MTTLTGLFFTIFVGLHLVLMLGVFLEYRRSQSAKAIEKQRTIPVSIIIPVHNEAFRIKPLLQSLLSQDYSSIQLIFVDDRSTDETGQLLSDFSKQFTRGNRTCHILTLTENPGPNYKQFGLLQGYKMATGELILLTDADCELPSTWVSGMVRRMMVEDTGLIIGPVFKFIPKTSFLYKTQAFDHAIRFMYAAASTGIGFAGAGFGNNMAVRKSALESVHGYQAVPPSVTEDAALISLIAVKTPFKVRAGLGADILVMTEAEKTWKEFIIQAVRWTKGGIFSPDLATRIAFSILMGMISLGILTLPFLLVLPELWPLPFAVFCAMLMNTSAALAISGDALKPLGPLDIFIQLLFTPVLNTLLTLMTLSRVPIYWKGKKV
jgi:cellulose synthase/poly-beta-1,6-N-acetylglucosamine synthase-like glycosyltransferase